MVTQVRIMRTYRNNGRDLFSVIVYGKRGTGTSGMITVQRDMGGWAVGGHYAIPCWYADFPDAIRSAIKEARALAYVRSLGGK